jgi:hypothetical protein
MVIGGGIGTHAIGATEHREIPAAPTAQINVASIIVSGGPTADGTLVKATTAVWEDIVRKLGNDWSVAIGFSSRQWEEIVAGAFKRLGYEAGRFHRGLATQEAHGERKLVSWRRHDLR